jgi:lambda repressor-like predicted transcriptional regulator
MHNILVLKYLIFYVSNKSSSKFFMELKVVVDGLLREKNRSMSWLADEMGKTFDGLKLSLVRGSIKYNDIIEMAKILEVPPAFFFPAASLYKENSRSGLLISEPKAEYSESKNNLKNCKEMLAALKDQLKDKEMIISLLNNRT